MSRQYDESIAGNIEIYGKTYEIIDPSNSKELDDAFRVKEAVETYISGLMHDEESAHAEEFLENQNSCIRDYVETIGEFNNTILSENIYHLAKKRGVRIGELEKLLGISAGYISRTAKENSGKRMSIDIVWKIARFFGIDIHSLTEYNQSGLQRNSELLKRFVSKLVEETRSGFITWDDHGKNMETLNSRYGDMGLCSKSGVEVEYHPGDIDCDERRYLREEIYSLEKFQEGKDLVVISFDAKKDEENLGEGCDFILVWKEGDSWKWEPFFTVTEKMDWDLYTEATWLVVTIQCIGDDIKVNAKSRKVIKDYLEGGYSE